MSLVFYTFFTQNSIAGLSITTIPIDLVEINS